MPYTGSIKTKSWVTVPGDSLRKTVLLAMRPVDTFTKSPVEVPMRVVLKEFPQARPIRSQSGFFCFEGLLDTEGKEELLFKAQAGVDYTLIAEPDRVVADWFYQQPRDGENWSFEFERKVRLVGRPIPPEVPNKPPPAPSQYEPIEWVPKPSYPFPANATLLRGIVTDGNEEKARRLSGIVVRAQYSRFEQPAEVRPGPKLVTVETLSDKQGEFVLFFKALPPSAGPKANPVTTQVIQVGPVVDGQFRPKPKTIEEGTTKNMKIVVP